MQYVLSSLEEQTTKVMTDGLTIIITVDLFYLGVIAYFYLIKLHNTFVPKKTVYNS